jgi:hypothetical protein
VELGGLGVLDLDALGHALRLHAGRGTRAGLVCVAGRGRQG